VDDHNDEDGVNWSHDTSRRDGRARRAVDLLLTIHTATRVRRGGIEVFGRHHLDGWLSHTPF